MAHGVTEIILMGYIKFISVCINMLPCDKIEVNVASTSAIIMPTIMYESPKGYCEMRKHS